MSASDSDLGPQDIWGIALVEKCVFVKLEEKRTGYEGVVSKGLAPLFCHV
jgi:hypothetical protein